MNNWIAAATLLSVWLYGLFILRGIGEYIQRLRHIENQISPAKLGDTIATAMNDNTKRNHL